MGPETEAVPCQVVCLGGPTGAGKTAIAIELAKRFDCEVVNADSRQVYADFPVITAQPDEHERASVPHRLYGFLPMQEKISAGIWSRRALQEIRAIISRGAIPLVVGGTGLYFQALLRGLTPIPAVPAAISEEFARRMFSQGAEALYRELEDADPVYAAKIHPHDRQRIQRALEVCAATGRAFSWWHQRNAGTPLCQGPYMFINTPLEELEPRLDARIDGMLAQGAVEEARKALAKCPDTGAPGWSGIGCAELAAWLQGDMDFSQCRALWLAGTRAYAKRQLTWFRQRKEAIPLASCDFDRACAIIEEHLQKWGRHF